MPWLPADCVKQNIKLGSKFHTKPSINLPGVGGGGGQGPLTCKGEKIEDKNANRLTFRLMSFSIAAYLKQCSRAKLFWKQLSVTTKGA